MVAVLIQKFGSNVNLIFGLLYMLLALECIIVRSI